MGVQMQGVHMGSCLKKLSGCLVLFLLACDAGVSQPDVGGETGGDPDLSAYFISPTLCGDSEGPDCTSLRLGDAHLTTSNPAQGKLFACTAGNANAPGSDPARITWIDWAAGTWNLLAKPFLPSGSFSPQPGVTNVSESGGIRSIEVNNLPVDGRIGDWPMSQYPLLSAIDRNPGIPAATSITFNLPINPVVRDTPTCTSLGAIGVTLNGVVLYNAVDARGNDAVAHEIVDEFGGHPAMSDYHYHFLPERLDSESMADGHSGLVGYIRDGFGLYGYNGAGGVELTNADLDECHGHHHAPLGYHYHATLEYPYTVGCYRGEPASPFLATSAEAGAPTKLDVDAEVAAPFLRGMIAHHVQALELTALVSERTRNGSVRRIAARMRIAQTEEIRLMRFWLENEISPGAAEGMPTDMPGMLSADRIQHLRRLSGAEFDRRFLELMMEHHRGAIVMAQALLESPGASSTRSAIGWFVMHIEAEQAEEVERMSRMLHGMD